MSAVVSCLSFSVLLVLMLHNVVHATFSFRPANSTCVWTERQLRKVIEKASSKTRTRITLCRQMIAISNTTDPDNTTGIDLSDRYIDLRCYRKRSKGACTLDGRGYSQIFKGRNADLTLRNVILTFAQSEDCYSGGAINLVSSNVSLIGCSFTNNGNGCRNGGAISVVSSTLKVRGGSRNWPVIFSNNECYLRGGALYASKSKVSIDGYTVFSDNIGGGGAVFLDESTFNIKNVKFVENFGIYASALSSTSSHSTMKNVDFIGNDGEFDAIDIFESSLQATDCTFANHKNTVIVAFDAKITLKNSIFSNNTRVGNGSNINIRDDNDPYINGTFVKCESNVVFCNGLGKTSIKESSRDDTIGDFNNTDCNTKGLQGTPGQGSCPV